MGIVCENANFCGSETDSVDKCFSAGKINRQYKKKKGSTSFGSAPNTHEWARFQSFSFKSVPVPEINQSMTISSWFIYNQTWFVERSSQASRYPCSCCCFTEVSHTMYSCHSFAAARSTTQCTAVTALLRSTTQCTAVTACWGVPHNVQLSFLQKGLPHNV